LNNALKFITKAFLGGCFGCLGVWIATVLVIALLGAIFATTVGPGLVNSVTGFIQSIPTMLGNTVQGLFSEGGGGNGGGQSTTPQPGMHFTNLTCPSDPVPQFKIFLTASNDPNSKHLNQFPTRNSTSTHFWVQVPEGVTVKFALVLTLSDGSAQIWDPISHPEYTSDPGGLPFSVGSFSSPAPLGEYQMTVYLCDTMMGGNLSFQITP